MADLPVEIDAGAAAPNEAAGNAGGDFLRGYATLPIVRQLGLMLALAATVAVGVSVVLWMREPDYKPLTGIGSARQANAAAEALQAANIPYRLDDSTGMLLVPAEVLHQARMKIAGVGGLSGDQEGFELLDKDQGFGVSQFMETNMFRRSLEGELARSITQHQLRTARARASRHSEVDGVPARSTHADGERDGWARTRTIAQHRSGARHHESGGGRRYRTDGRSRHRRRSVRTAAVRAGRRHRAGRHRSPVQIRAAARNESAREGAQHSAAHRRREPFHRRSGRGRRLHVGRGNGRAVQPGSTGAAQRADVERAARR